MLKSFEELRHGECKVITKQGKIFKGFFHSEYPCVFFAMPSNYEIIGYMQD